MNVVYLGLGSNLGDKDSNIRRAITNINECIGEVTSLSSIHETKPVGFVSDNLFANAACCVKTILSPSQILDITQEIETEMGRRSKSDNEVYTDRIIDIDILMYNDEIIVSPKLTLPHPYLHKRTFVLDPLSEIADNVYHPVLKKTIMALKNELRALG